MHNAQPQNQSLPALPGADRRKDHNAYAEGTSTAGELKEADRMADFKGKGLLEVIKDV